MRIVRKRADTRLLNDVGNARINVHLQSPENVHDVLIPTDKADPVACHVVPFRKRVERENTLTVNLKNGRRRCFEIDVYVATLIGCDKDTVPMRPLDKTLVILARGDGTCRGVRIVDPDDLRPTRDVFRDRSIVDEKSVLFKKRNEIRDTFGKNGACLHRRIPRRRADNDITRLNKTFREIENCLFGATARGYLSLRIKGHTETATHVACSSRTEFFASDVTWISACCMCFA